MKHIKEQIDIFLAESGISQRQLALKSGVNVVYIHRLTTGKQRDLYSSNADALRIAMQELDPKAAQKALD
jgi:predicted transcriptional regulator